MLIFNFLDLRRRSGIEKIKSQKGLVDIQIGGYIDQIDRSVYTVDRLKNKQDFIW